MLISPALTAFADGGAPNLAYIAGSKTGISVIDIRQQKVTTNFSLSGDPHTIYLSLDGRFLYVTQPALGRVIMLAAKTGQTVCNVNVPGQPSLLAFDPYSIMLYAAGNAASSVTEFDPSNCRIKQTLQTNGPVYGLAVAIVGSSSTDYQLWVSDPSGLEVFDHGKRIATIPIPGGPQYVCIPPGFSAYVTTQQGNLYAVSLSTRQVSPPILTVGQFGPMDYDAYTRQVYVPDSRNKQVDVLAPIAVSNALLRHEPDHTIRMGIAPQSVAITGDGQFGFIALAGGNVAILDVPGRKLISTIYIGGSPYFIITGLYPPVFGTTSQRTTPQQLSIWGTVIKVIAYALVLALLMIPIVFIVRRTRAKSTKTK
jgi:DNA-binding beta-propeller fold protein YncE